MGTFHNPTAQVLRFDIDRDRYAVPPGAECEIPRALEYVPAARGLPLAKGPHPTPGAPRAEPTAVPRPGVRSPPGVEAGALARALPDDDDAVPDDDGAPDPAADAPPTASVAEAADALVAAGVVLPGVAKRRR
jgi:hypothetical protein